MSRRNTRSQAAVESLLDERRRYQEWLEKLAVPGAAGTPSPVVERVRVDYQSRLDNVTRLLAKHEGELETALAEAELRRDQAAGQRTARQEALAEAVLRHDVGEYDEEKFAGINAEHASFLAQLAEDIEAADRDITRIEEVLELIARVLPEPAPSPAGPAAPAAPPAGADTEALGRVAAHFGGLDELSFLRSVASGAKVGPATPVGGPAPGAATPATPAAEAPASGAAAPTPGPAPEPLRPPRVSRPVMPSPEAAPPTAPPRAPAPEAAGPVPPPPAPEPGPEATPPPRAERAAESRKVDAPFPSPVEHIVPEIHEARPSARVSKKGVGPSAEAEEITSRKTLRCLECETLNLPTEWYCEKCGAELSAF